MVADRILHPGESKSVTAKQADLYKGDSELEIKNEAAALPPLSFGHLPKSGEERPDLGEKKKVRKPRGKKK